MEKQEQLQALANAIQALNALPITGAQSDLITGIKNLIGQVGQAMQKELGGDAPLTSTGNTGEAVEEAPAEAPADSE